MTSGKNGAVSDDLTWVELREPWQRLRWARARSKFETARAAAESMGMNEATYSAYERRPDSSKSIPLSHQKAIQFARKFKVRWEWLLTGEGSPHSEEPDPNAPVTRIIRSLGEVPLESQSDVADAVEAMVRAAKGGDRRR